MKIKFLLLSISFLTLSVIIHNAMKHTVQVSADRTIQESAPQISQINPEIVSTFKIAPLAEADSKEFYEKWLAQEELEIWKGLEKFFGINKQQCNDLKVQWHDEYVNLVAKMNNDERAPEQITQENKDLIGSILKECGLNPETVSPVNWNKPISGGSTDSTVFINQSRIAPMPLEVKKYVIAHEIAHVVNQDHSTDFVLVKLRQLKNIPETPELNQALEKFAHFKELRADIMAMLHGKEYAQGQIAYMEFQLKCAGVALENTNSSATHPTDFERYNVGKKLLAFLN